MTEEIGLIVGRHYLMNSEFEDLIYGAELQDGMIVLLEDPIMRGDPDRTAESPFERHRVLEANRWCEVTRLQVSGDLMRFIGLYGDGTKISRSYHRDHTWIVKKETRSTA